MKQLQKKHTLAILGNGIMVKYFNKTCPVWIDFRITTQCNLRCRYCNIPSTHIKEMSMDQIKLVIDKINGPGRVILLTGGEPLMRKDIGDIVRYFVYHSDCEVRLNTNLLLLKKKYNEIKECHGFFFSLDGSKETHEKNKGPGSWKGLEQGLRILHSDRRGKISMTVITHHTTLDDIKVVLDMCTTYEILPAFQIVRHYSLSNESKEINPDTEKVIKIFEYLLDMRKKGFKMMNSKKGLMGQIELAQGILNAQCFSGKLLCTIDPDGVVGLCFSRSRNREYLNITNEKVTFKNALYALHKVKGSNNRCQSCTCMAPIEFSLCNFMNIDVLVDNFIAEQSFKKQETLFRKKNTLYTESIV